MQCTWCNVAMAKNSTGHSYFTEKFKMTHLVVLTLFKYKTFNVFISMQMSTNYLCCTERFPLSWSSLFMFCVLSTSTGSESVYILTALAMVSTWVAAEEKDSKRRNFGKGSPCRKQIIQSLLLNGTIDSDILCVIYKLLEQIC